MTGVLRGDRLAFMARLEEVDRDGAVEVACRLLAGGVAFDEIVRDLLAPCQQEVGRRWERGEWSEADEHAATAVTDAVLAVLALEASPRRHAGPRVLVATGSGDWHGVAARMVCEVLCVRGWQAQLVGPSPPAAALGSFAARHEPVAVALSCSTVTNLPGAKACIDAVHGAGIPVLAGGHGFGRDGVLAEAVGADAWAPDVVTGVGILSSWVDEAPPLRRPAPEPPSDHHRLLAGRDDLIRAVASAVGAGPEASELVIHAVDTAVAGALVTRPDLLRGEVPWMERVAAGRGLPAHLAGAIVAAVERERGRGAT